jgi:SAM-dependent methyltransferase
MGFVSQTIGRQRLLRHVLGRGLEVGPGHVPLVVPGADLEIRYVDRWEPDENRELFPELEGATFPQPDLVLDLNKDGLACVASESESFVVASHILEHLANPIRVLAEFHRVLRPGGVVLILLPDRRLTFDEGRPGTSLDHLVEEYENDVDEVDEEHLVEFLTHIGAEGEISSASSSDGDRREAILSLQRRRSIHVHCWTFEEFVEVINYSIERLGHAWQFVDGLLADESDPVCQEFGLVLRRSSAEVDPSALAKLFRESLSAWVAEERSPCKPAILAEERRQALERLEAEMQSTESRLRDAEECAASLSQALAERTAALDAVLGTRTFRYTRLPRAAYDWLRAFRRQRG